jgi:GNAT superfamily N-acetyltransferase
MTGNVTGGRDGDAATPAPADRSAAASVRLLELRDVPVAARVLTLAFADEPAKHALFGDEATSSSPFADANTRTRFTEAVAGGRLRAAARYAAVHVAEVDGTIAGVAMWYPPGVQPAALPSSVVVPALLAPGTRVLSLIARVGGLLWQDRNALKRLLAGRTAAAKQAGRGTSWYLAVLGTDPCHRGRGVARQLLERRLERCDAEGLPAWLETTEQPTTALYARFGFETIAAIEGGMVLPGLWVMRREPRRRHRARERRRTPGAPA